MCCWLKSSDRTLFCPSWLIALHSLFLDCVHCRGKSTWQILPAPAHCLKVSFARRTVRPTGLLSATFLAESPGRVRCPDWPGKSLGPQLCWPNSRSADRPAGPKTAQLTMWGWLPNIHCNATWRTTLSPSTSLDRHATRCSMLYLPSLGLGQLHACLSGPARTGHHCTRNKPYHFTQYEG